MAGAMGMADSAVASASFFFLVATPTSSPYAGTYPAAVTISISDATAGATIHYTTDGSTPTTASPVYSGPIMVTQNTASKAMGAASAVAHSTPSTASE